MDNLCLPQNLRAKSLSFTKAGLIASVLFISGQVRAQDAFKGLENLFAIPQNYVVKHTAKAPVIDGDIEEPIWQQAKWTNDFVDIEGDLKPKPPLQTNVKMLWDDSCLYIAARLSDPQLWAKLKNHDDIIYKENDFELFIDPLNTTHNYYEVEVNALNTIFDLFITQPYRNKGGAVPGWDVHDLRSTVKVQGTLNDPKDTDKGWTVEMAIPFKAVSPGLKAFIPRHGTVWRINFSRVQYDTRVQNGEYVKLKDTVSGRDLPEHNWVWSAQGLIDMHYPERWGYLLFSDHTADDTVFEMPYSEQQRKYLWLVYYRQKEWYRQKHVYATSLKELGIESSYNILKKFNNLQLEASKHQFMALIYDKDNKTAYTIDQDGFVGSLTTEQHE